RHQGRHPPIPGGGDPVGLHALGRGDLLGAAGAGRGAEPPGRVRLRGPDGRRPGPAARQETAAPRQTRMTTTAAARATHHGRQESTAMQPQWTPTADDIAEATITHFARFAAERGSYDLPENGDPGDYQRLWQWSVRDLPGFWRAVWEYFDLGDLPGEVLAEDRMPGAVWFPGTRLNYVDRVLRQSRADRPAILAAAEDEPPREVSWAELLGRTAALAQTLRDLGVTPGDRVVGYLPNSPEAVVAFLATASIGAVWSACGQDYSPKAALDRLGQLEPTVLITADGYRFGGRAHDKSADIAALRAGLPTLRSTVVVHRLGVDVPGTTPWTEAATPGESTPELRPEPVAFDHPLWIVFSSGTTGLPKGIVHGHGGVVLEHLKAV